MTRLKAGGWKKRGPNKLLYAGEVAASDLLPLDYMLSVMRDPPPAPSCALRWPRGRCHIATRVLRACSRRAKIRLLRYHHRSMSTSSSLVLTVTRLFRYPLALRWI